MRCIASIFALILLTLPAGPVKAAPILWTLHDVEFSTGQAVTGSFWYDANTNLYSLNGTIDITPSTPEVPEANSFSSVWTITAFTSYDSQLVVKTDNDPEWNWVLSLDWDGVLTNAGGVLPVYFASRYRCFAIDCSSVGASASPYNMGSPSPTGYVSASVVPLPAALPLFLSGLALLGAIRWRRH